MKCTRLNQVMSIVAAAILGVTTSAVSGQTWQGGTGQWDDNLMWSGLRAPNNCYLNDPPDCPAFFHVMVDGGNGINSLVQIGEAGHGEQFTIDSLTISSGDIVQIIDDSYLRLDTDRDGFLHNDGEIIISGDGDLNAGGIHGGQNPLMITGSGTITLAGTNALLNGIATSGGEKHLINSSNTIQGFGKIGAIGNNGPQVTNQVAGLIVANVDGQTLQMDPDQDGVLNQGIMRATSGGELRLVGGNYTNENVIEALEGSTITLGGSAFMVGGTIRSIGTGSIEVLGSSSGPSITDLTLQGTVNHYDGNFYLYGGIDNQSDFFVIDGSLVNNALTSLFGGGSINLGATFSEISGVGELTNVDNKIRGYGRIWAQGGFTNEASGLVDADVAGQTMVVRSDNNGGEGVFNQGTFCASNGGDLELRDWGAAFDNTGGVIEAFAGSTVTLQGADIFGGILRSVDSGTFEIPVAGTSVEDLSLFGAVNVVGSGQLNLLGTLDNQADIIVNGGARIVVNTSANIIGDGTINLPSASPLSQISGTGDLTIVGGTVTGIGDINVTTVFDGGTISPGNSISTLDFNRATTWVNNTTLQIELGATTGTAGTDWDWCDVRSFAINLNDAVLPAGLTIELTSLDSNGDPGELTGFDPLADYSWAIATATNITGFNPANISIDTSAFANALAGTVSVSMIDGSTDQLVVNYFGGTACPIGGVLMKGSGQINTADAACVSDDVYWAAHGATFAFRIDDPVVQFELTSMIPVGFGSTALSVDLEASKDSNNGNLNLRVKLFDYNIGQFVALLGTMPLTTTDAVQTFDLPAGANPEDFLAPGTNEVRISIETIQTSGLPNVRTQLDQVMVNFE